jgi:hypothetical protein
MKMPALDIGHAPSPRARRKKAACPITNAQRSELELACRECFEGCALYLMGVALSGNPESLRSPQRTLIEECAKLCQAALTSLGAEDSSTVYQLALCGEVASICAIDLQATGHGPIVPRFEQCAQFCRQAADEYERMEDSGPDNLRGSRPMN